MLKGTKIASNSVWTLGVGLLIAACGGPEPQTREEYVVLGGKADGAPPAVQLLYAESWNHQKYGMSSKDKRFVVRVQNIAYHKAVAIHYRTTRGEWADLPATYVREADDTTEIWEAKAHDDDFDGPFVVKYQVAGVTYWDNNNWRDYSIGAEDGVMLGTGIDVRVGFATSTIFSGGVRSFRGTIDVRNLAYDKKVVVHYSTNNWQSEKTAEAWYLGSWRNYGYSGTPNPNAHGIEGWTFEVMEPAEEVDFYVSYEVAGRKIVDDNYGRSYHVNGTQGVH